MINFECMNGIARMKLALYSSLFVSAAVNLPQLLALRPEGIFTRYHAFNHYEFTFRLIFNFLFCLAFFSININNNLSFSKPWTIKKEGTLLLTDIGVLLAFFLVGSGFNMLLFRTAPDPHFPGQGYGLRLSSSAFLIAVELKIVHLLEKNRQKDLENEHLRNAYLKTELEVLKGQLNPHFFFNALSSLSAIVREDPQKAQHYISQLSKFFRYTLQRTDNHLIPLGDEMTMLHSYTELLKMRYEEGFLVTICIGEYGHKKMIPHMSLQPLVENAVKHNITGIHSPLHINISIENDLLVIKNNLQPLKVVPAGSGIGLVNLNERFRILLKKEIEIEKTDLEFIVKLPLS